MAVTIFSKQAGMVASFPDPTLPATTTLNVEGWGGFTGFKSIITRVNVAAQGNFQFLHTLGGNIYVYVFGDRVGSMGISGLAFESVCNDAAGTIGIERVLDYYAQNRIAARKTPLKVTVGVKTTLAGYLVAVTGDVVDPKSKIYQFNLQFIMAPQSRIPCSPAGDSDDDGGDNEEPSDPGDGDDSIGHSLQDPSYPVPEGSVNKDGSFPGNANKQVSASGYNAFGTGPNTRMVV
jgi:hypothetical protein